MTDLEELRAEQRAEHQEKIRRTLNERKQTQLQKKKRRKLCVTLPPDLYIWLHEKVADGSYYNISHAIESCIKQTRTHVSKRND